MSTRFRYRRSALLLLAAVLVGVFSGAHASKRNIKTIKTAAGDSSHVTHHAHRVRHRRVAKDNITFGIILSAFERDSDPYFRLPCANSFYGIAQQTYKDWYLLLNGDGISSQGVGRMFRALKAAGVPEEKVIFRNMEPSRRERFLYKENLNYEHWLFSGVNSLNMALEIAYDQLPVTHVARLDEDDFWLPSHLQNLADVYSQHPDVGFIYTQALGYSNPFNNDNTDHGFPHPETNLHTFRPPVPCELIHSTASWTTHLRIFYRQLDEQRQQLHDRSMETCCRRPCNTVLAADADMWERIHGLVQRGDLASVFVSHADVVYMVSSTRENFLDLLSNNAWTAETIERARSRARGGGGEGRRRVFNSSPQPLQPSGAAASAAHENPSADALNPKCWFLPAGAVSVDEVEDGEDERSKDVKVAAAVAPSSSSSLLLENHRAFAAQNCCILLLHPTSLHPV